MYILTTTKKLLFIWFENDIIGIWKDAVPTYEYQVTV